MSSTINHGVWFLGTLVDVLVVKFANVMVDGISMGFGDFLSNATDKDFSTKEGLGNMWEILVLEQFMFYNKNVQSKVISTKTEKDWVGYECLAHYDSIYNT